MGPLIPTTQSTRGCKSLAEQTKNILIQEMQLTVKATPLIASHSSMLPQKAALSFDEMSMHCREKMGPTNSNKT